MAQCNKLSGIWRRADRAVFAVLQEALERTTSANPVHGCRVGERRTCFCISGNFLSSPLVLAVLCLATGEPPVVPG